MRDTDTGGSKGYAFINFASFDASDAALEAMNGQYLCNRPITVSYAFKKDSKGERHGSEAERFLAAQNPLPQAERPHQLFADAPPIPTPGMMPPQMMQPPGPPMFAGQMPPMPPPMFAGQMPFGFPPGSFPPGGMNPFGPPMGFAPAMMRPAPPPPPPPMQNPMQMMPSMVPPPVPPPPPPPPPPGMPQGAY